MCDNVCILHKNAKRTREIHCFYERETFDNIRKRQPNTYTDTSNVFITSFAQIMTIHRLNVCHIHKRTAVAYVAPNDLLCSLQ